MNAAFADHMNQIYGQEWKSLNYESKMFHWNEFLSSTYWR